MEARGVDLGEDGEVTLPEEVRAAAETEARRIEDEDQGRNNIISKHRSDSADRGNSIGE
jgi:hypothetical protein